MFGSCVVSGRSVVLMALLCFIRAFEDDGKVRVSQLGGRFFMLRNGLPEKALKTRLNIMMLSIGQINDLMNLVLMEPVGLALPLPLFGKLILIGGWFVIINSGQEN